MTQDGFCPYKQKSEHALTTIISLCMCPFMSAKLCLGYVRIEKSPDLVLYLITLKWSYASSPHVFQHLNIHMWVYNCLSPYNLLRLICFISPERSSESDFFFTVCVYCDGINLYDGVTAFLLLFFEIFFLYFVCSFVLGYFFNLSSLGGLLLHLVSAFLLSLI